MKKLFGLMMFMVMLFCFSNMAIADDGMPSTIKANYESGKLTDIEYCESLMIWGYEIMQARQLNQPKSGLLKQLPEFSEWSQEFLTLLINNAYDRIVFNSMDNKTTAIMDFGNDVFDYCMRDLVK